MENVPGKVRNMDHTQMANTALVVKVVGVFIFSVDTSDGDDIVRFVINSVHSEFCTPIIDVKKKVDMSRVRSIETTDMDTL